MLVVHSYSATGRAQSEDREIWGGRGRGETLSKVTDKGAASLGGRKHLALADCVVRGYDIIEVPKPRSSRRRNDENNE